jgi:uncharacterized protein (DUF1778 family)
MLYNDAEEVTMSKSITQHAERVDLRLSADLKALLTRAATYSGMSLSSFLVSVASERAREVVAQHETLTLSPRDWDAFLKALDEPEGPRPQLEEAVRRYRRRRSSRGVG